MSDELREKVARVLANAMGEIGDDVWKFYLREADAAIALVSGEQAARIEQLEAALRDILSKSCDAFYETANMLDDDDFSGEVPGRSGTVIGHREEYHRYMVEALTKAGDAAREALTAMEQQIMDPNFPKNEREWWAAARIEQLEAALRAAYEVYAGSEGCIAETCAEGYQQQIITQMVDCISAALEASDD